MIDPLRNPAEFAKLIDAILGKASGALPRLTDEPYVGLRAMTEKESDRFFGRDAEIAELVEDLRHNRLVAIGSGRRRAPSIIFQIATPSRLPPEFVTPLIGSHTSIRFAWSIRFRESISIQSQINISSRTSSAEHTE
jgi:hypothetical protein